MGKNSKAKSAVVSNTAKNIMIAVSTALMAIILVITALLFTLGSAKSASSVNDDGMVYASADTGVQITLMGKNVSDENINDLVAINGNSVNLSYPGTKLPNNTASIVDNPAYTDSIRYYRVVFQPGTYDIVLNGAQGGSTYNYVGGYGAITKGRVTFTTRTVTYLHVGGGGQGIQMDPILYNDTVKNPYKAYGGYNGGGDGYFTGGGGATDLRLKTSTVTNNSKSNLSIYNSTASLESRIMVAGGGGGAVYPSNGNNAKASQTEAKDGKSNRGGTSDGKSGGLGVGGEYNRYDGPTSDSVLSFYGYGGGGGGYYGGASGYFRARIYHLFNLLMDVSAYSAGAGSSYINASYFKSNTNISTGSGNGGKSSAANGSASITKVSGSATINEGIKKVQADLMYEHSTDYFYNSESESSYYSYNASTLTLNFPRFSLKTNSGATNNYTQNNPLMGRYWRVRFMPGVYKFDLYGAQGGIDHWGGLGGYGGQTTTTVTLTKETYLYFYIGGAGEGGQLDGFGGLQYGGYNGGGAVRGGCDGGGGATDVRLSPGQWYEQDSLYTRIAVAGGGGGANDRARGGNGGGLTGGAGVREGSSMAVLPTGASQTKGGENSYLSILNGTFGVGGGLLVHGTTNLLTPSNLFADGKTQGAAEGGGGGGGYYGGAKASGYTASGSGGSGFAVGANGCTPLPQLTNALTNAGLSTSSFKSSTLKAGVNGVTTATAEYDENNTYYYAKDGFATITYVGDVATQSNTSGVTYKLKGDALSTNESINTYSYANGENVKLYYPTATLGANSSGQTTTRYWELNFKRGAYKITLAGGEGGWLNDNYQSITSNTRWSGKGGRGAVVTATIVFDRATTMYLHIGGGGAAYTPDNIKKLGGYNGGGDAVTGSSGGGGATDLRYSDSSSLTTNSGNTLTKRTSTLSSRIMVAGGGGGANDNQNGGNAGGVSQSNLNGMNGVNRVGSAGRGGTLTGGGSGKVAGKLGLGGGGGNADGGGGGGGYYGGGSGNGNEASGGGGSSFVSGCTYGSSSCNIVNGYKFTDLQTIGANYSTEPRMSKGELAMRYSKDGYASIERVNAAPEAKKEAQVITASRGLYIDFEVTDYAIDRDGAKDTDVVWDDKLYVYNSSANTYTSDTTHFVVTRSSEKKKLTVKLIVYPLAGELGVSTNGTINVYAKVSDLGKDSKDPTNALSTYIPITFKFAYEPPKMNDNNSGVFTANSGSDTYTHNYTTSDASGLVISNDSPLYLDSGDRIKLTADMFSNEYSGDTVYFNPGNYICAYNEGQKTEHKLKANTMPTGIIYTRTNSSFKAYTGQTGNELILYAINATVNTTYVCQVIVYQVDGSNRALISQRTVNVTFRVANRAPTPLGGDNSAKILDLTVGGTKSININEIITDRDCALISERTHNIIGVAVNSTDLYFKDSKHYNENASSATGTLPLFTSDVISDIVEPNAYVKYSYSSGRLTLTGLRATHSLYPESRQNALGDFYITLTIRDLANVSATYYAPVAVRVLNTAPVKFNNNSNGQNDVSIEYSYSTMPTVEGNVGDVFYLAPMAVQAGTSAPYSNAFATDTNNVVVGNNSNVIGVLFDYDNFRVSKANSLSGAYNEWLEFADIDNQNFIDELYSSLDMRYQTTGSSYVNDETFFTLEITNLYIPKNNYVADSKNRFINGDTTDGTIVYKSDTNQYKLNKVVTSLSYNSGTHDFYQIKGIKVTLNNYTDKYFTTQLNVNDAYGLCNNGESISTNIAIKVNNTVPKNKENADIFTSSRDDSRSISLDEHEGKLAVTYNIRVNDTIYFTPYDLVSDLNLLSSDRGTKYETMSKFNINGIAGKISNDKFVPDTSRNGLFYESGSTLTNKEIKTLLSSIDAGRRIYRTAIDSNTFEGGLLDEVYIKDSLKFERTTDGKNIANVLQNSGTRNTQSLKLETDTSTNTRKLVTATSYAGLPLDIVAITAQSRSSAAAVLEFNIFDSLNLDSTSNPITVYVKINVVNSPPVIADAVANKQLGAGDLFNDFTITTAPKNGQVSSLRFTARYTPTIANGLLDDIDDTDLAFDTTKPIEIMTLDPSNNYVNTIQVGSITHQLSEYISAEYNAAGTELIITALSSTQALPKGAWVAFYATDRRQSVRLYLQIEVLDAPILTYSNGEYSSTFATKTSGEADAKIAEGNGSTIETILVNDTKPATGSPMPYYMVSSLELANALVEGKVKSTSTIDSYIFGDYSSGNFNTVTSPISKVRLLATDSDALQNQMVLAPYVSPNDSFVGENYLYVGETLLNRYMPNIGTSATYVDGVNGIITKTENISNLSLYYYVKGDDGNFYGYKSNVLFELLRTQSSDDAFGTYFFDNLSAESKLQINSRWNAVYWAVVATPPDNGFAYVTNDIKIQVRTSGSYGGDTLGANDTSYWGNRQQGIDVKKCVESTRAIGVKFNVVATDFTPYTEYVDQYNGVYTVHSRSNDYVPTYDNDLDTIYSAVDGYNSLEYEYSNGVIKQVTNDTGFKVISNGLPDMSFAGANTGLAYSSSKPASDYLNSGAFVYSNTIEIPDSTRQAAIANSVYLPISYFAVPSSSSITGYTTGSQLDYSTDSYVTYSNNGAPITSLTETVNILKAITLTDTGTGNSWSGANLNSNPYVAIGSVTGVYTSEMFADLRNSPYINKAISMSSYSSDTAVNTYLLDNGAIRGSLTSNFSRNGELYYLLQTMGVGKAFKEHDFGITVAKKDLRNTSGDLVLTVNLIKQTGGNASGSKTIPVSVKLNVENSPIDLVTDNTVKADDKGYYTELKLNNGSQTVNYDLTTTDKPANETQKYIKYTDKDITTLNNGVSDTGKFYLASTQTIANIPEPTLSRIKEVADDKFVNASTDANTQKSLLNYFGISSAAGVSGVASNYQPNSGVYGTNNTDNYQGYKIPGITPNQVSEGYSSYFNVVVTSSGALSISPRAKTLINDVALDELKAIYEAEHVTTSWTEDNLRKLYATRGLVPVFSGDNIVSSYYPLKVLIYDDNGAGVNYASFTEIEIRVEITNSAPTINTDTVTQNGSNYLYSFNMLKGETTTVSLSNIVNDVDFARDANYNIYTKVGFENNASRISRETGDYLNITESTNNDYATNKIDSSQKSTLGTLITANDKAITSYSSTDVQEGDLKESASILFKVNDRNYASVEFNIFLSDNNNAPIENMMFVVGVSNQRPTVEAISEQTISMKSGEYFTILATSFTKFSGNGIEDSAAMKSKSYDIYQNNKAAIGAPSANGSIVPKTWEYSDMTDARLRESAYAFGVSADVSEYSRGFLAVADDDAPYALRINLDTVANKNTLRYVSSTELNTIEGEYSGGKSPTAYMIQAKSACNNARLTFTITDGEGASINYTVVITIVSQSPTAITDAGKLSTNLTKTDVAGVYDLYLSPSAVSTYDYTDNGGVIHKVNKKVQIPLKQIVTDADLNDNDNLSLYQYWNDTSIQISSDRFFTAKEERINYNGLNLAAITIDCKSYNTNEAFSGSIQFYVKDPGNESVTNACYIKINVYTLYSSVFNNSYADAQSTLSTQTTSWKSPYSISVTSKYDSESIDSYNGDSFPLLNTPSTTTKPITDRISDDDFSGAYNVSVYALVAPNNEGSFDGLKVNGQTVTPYYFTNRYLRDNGGSLVGSGSYLDSNGKAYYYVDENNTSFSNEIGGTRILTVTSTGAINRTAYYNNFTPYFTLDISSSDSGLDLLFSPVSYMDEILMYVQIEKVIGRNDLNNIALKSGFLFNVNVENSKPKALNDTFTFEGYKGDSATFAIDNKLADSGMSSDRILFTDYDLGDNVTLPKTNYYEVSSTAPSDWRSPNKGMAVAFKVDGNNLTVIINRRVDLLYSGSSSYEPKVTIPVTVKASDGRGSDSTSTTVINVVINNNNPTGKDDVSYLRDDDPNVSYSTGYDRTNNFYTLDAYVKVDGKPLTVNFADIISDLDYDEERAKNNVFIDSYRISGAIGTLTTLTPRNVSEDLGGDGALLIHKTESGNNYEVASILANRSVTDPYNYSGFTITALSSNRAHTASFYINILDRSATMDKRVTFRVTVNISNSAPTVISGKDNASFVISGRESSATAASSKTIDVRDFVTDPNASDISNLYVSMVEMVAPKKDDFASLTLSAADATQIVNVSLVTENEDGSTAGIVSGQKVTITPIVGYYGKQTVKLTVSDSTISNSLSTVVTITINVTFNKTELPTLTSIETHRASRLYITVDTLMSSFLAPHINDDIDNENGGTNDGDVVESSAILSSSSGVSTSADETDEDATQLAKFRPAVYYTISKIEPSNLASANYFTIVKDEILEGWWLTADKASDNKVCTLTVTFTETLTGEEFKRDVSFVINENTKPKLIDEFTREKLFSKTSGDAYQLSENGIVTLSYELIVTDDEGDEVKFVKVKSNTPSLVSVKINENGSLVMQFMASGSADIVLTVADITEENHDLKITVSNVDMPSPGMWLSIVISFEENSIIWYSSIAALVLLIVVIIIVVVVHKKRAAARAALEAELIAEMELEENLLQLSSGDNMQSFGYLPPTQGNVDPSSLLGSGQNTPQVNMIGAPADSPDNAALGLNAGQGDNNDNNPNG